MTQPNDLSGLHHAELGLQSGGKIVLLNTGPLISPEEEATAQAKFSRDPSVIAELLNVLAVEGPKKFMQKTYVGYGHKSVADNGSITVLFERVSMPAAKALQGFALYNGQECSTRYIDFTNQPFLDPTLSGDGQRLMEGQRAFYLKALKALQADMKRRFPYRQFKKAGESKTIYDKTINARAFDVARGFLPAGCSTNVAWHGELRIFDDQIPQLRNHPLAEIRNIGETLEALLMARLPHTFSRKRTLGVAGAHSLPKRYWETEQYLATVAREFYYHHPERTGLDALNFVCKGCDIDPAELEQYRSLLEARPAHAELPKALGVLGTIRYAFDIDYGGYRDLQRQRSVTQAFPLLTEDIGFHPWYLNELPKKLHAAAAKHLAQLSAELDAMELSRPNRQYFLPMGYQVRCDFRGDLPAWVYIWELRSGTTVHATVRLVSHKGVAHLHDTFAESGLVLHADTGPDRFDLKRGTQDIVTTT